MQKTFDCVKMKRLGAEKVQQVLAGKTAAERLQFWRERTAELRQRREKAQQRAA